VGDLQRQGELATAVAGSGAGQNQSPPSGLPAIITCMSHLSQGAGLPQIVICTLGIISARVELCADAAPVSIALSRTARVTKFLVTFFASPNRIMRQRMDKSMA
jgi:hypothetical protein